MTDERKRRKTAYLEAMKAYLTSPPGAPETAARLRVEVAYVEWREVENADA